MTFKKLHIHASSYKSRLERELRIRDENGWLQGRYFAQAISACFSKTSKYPEKPYLHDVELGQKDKQLSEEELRKQNELFFANLAVMQANFERTHPKTDQLVE